MYCGPARYVRNLPRPDQAIGEVRDESYDNCCWYVANTVCQSFDACTGYLGWGTAEVLGTKVIPLWVGARGVEFQWDNLQSAIDANLNLVSKLSMLEQLQDKFICMQLFLMIIGMLLWLWNRKDLNRSLFPFLAFLLTVIYYRPVILRTLQYYGGFDMWTMLLIKFGMVCITGVITLQMYTTMSPPPKS